MKKRVLRKNRVLSLVLIFFMLTSLATPVFADNTPNISADALRVSDEFVATYPNGVLEFATVQFNAEENSQAFDVIVARRGGTQGEVAVDFKVIEMTAKYGEDFEVLMPTWYGNEPLKKDGDSPTLLESSLEANKDGVITAPVDAGTSPAAVETETSPAAVETETSPAAVATEASPAAEQTEIQASVPVYQSSLHQLRDEATGTITEAPRTVDGTTDIFEIQNPQQIEVGDALNTLLPGASGHLVFQEGENYQTFRIKVKNDTVFEGPETFTIGLFDPTNGAALGDNFNTIININDDDPGVGQIIGFEEESYYVDPSTGEALLKIQRSGDVNTYAKIELSTISGTAQADVHYTPIITEAMFLPGEESKKVSIPLLVNEVKQELSFTMAITEDGAPTKGNSRATITLLPSADSSVSIASEVSLMAAPARINPYIRINGDEFAHEESMGGNVFGSWSIDRFYKQDGYSQMPLYYFQNRWGSMVKWLDTRGISAVSWSYANFGYNNGYNLTRVELTGSNSYERSGQFDGVDWAGEGSGMGLFSRQDGITLRFFNKTWGFTDGNLRINSVTLTRQSFPIIIENGDEMTYSSYDANNVKTDRTFRPGTVTADIAQPYRDEVVTLTPQLTNDGALRGARLIGYQVKKPNDTYTDVFRGNTIKLTPDFIETYIYGGFWGTLINAAKGKYWHEELTIKPVFDREPSTYLEVGSYDSTQGTIKVNGTTYNNSLVSGYSGKFVGDEMTVNVTASVANKVTGVSVTERNTGTTQTVAGSGDVKIRVTNKCFVQPLFEKNTKDIAIKWKSPSTGIVETKADNLKRGMIFHDKLTNMPISERNLLYQNMSGITRPVLPVRDNYTSNAAYDAAMVQYELALDSYFSKIAANYPAYRDAYQGSVNANGFLLDEVINEDTVTLYAKPQDGYTVIWWTNLTGAGGTQTDQESLKRSIHVGSSYTFEVSPGLTEVYYYFDRVNDYGNQIATGQVVSSFNTIKNQRAFAVDKNDPSTYKGVPGIQVSVATADNKNASKTVTVNGVATTYTTTATTDANGNFKIYLPNSAAERVFSIKLVNGEKIYSRSMPVANVGQEKFVLLEIPFMDEYKVANMTISNESLYGGVEINEDSANINVTTSTDLGRTVSKVKIRSYDANGNLWTSWDASTTDSRNWTVYVSQKKEAFKHNGRLTVELYDSRMIGHGEIESGYILTVPPKEGDVTMPATQEYGSKTQDPMGTIVPSADLGTTRSMTPVPRNGVTGDGTYAIAVGAGEIIQQVIKNNINDFDKSSTLQNKLSKITSFMREGVYSTNLANKKYTPPKDKAGGVKSGRGKGNVSVNFDIGFYVQLTRNGDTWFFDYSAVYIAVGLDARQDFTASICGVPVYMTLKGGGSAKGLIMAQGTATTTINTVFGYFPVGSNLSAVQFAGIMDFNLYVSIGAGVGQRGLLSIGISGRMDLDIQYQPWDAAKGVMTFALNVDIDVLIIPITFKVASYTFTLFQTGTFDNNNWLPQTQSIQQNVMLHTMNTALEEQSIATIGVLPRARSSGWSSETVSLQSQEASLMGMGRTTSQTGIYKHPEPEIISLGKNSSDVPMSMLFYINDDSTRGDYDRTAVYYTLLTGTTPSALQKLQDDGTGDYDLNVKRVGDRIAVTWSSYTTPFAISNTTQPGLATQLNYNDIYLQFFDLEGNTSGGAVRLTKDNGLYANSSPQIAYDQSTGNIMVAYTKTDYTSTAGITFDGTSPAAIGNFLNNAYTTVAYRLYDGAAKTWQTTYGPQETSYLDYEQQYGAGSLNGQRFLDFNMSGVLSPRVSELSAAAYGGKAVLSYTLDIDQNPNTRDDTELFMLVYDFSTKQFTKPIRLTDDLDPDTNSQLMRNGSRLYLFWNDNASVSYIELDGILSNGITKTTINGTEYWSVSAAYDYIQSVQAAGNADAADSFKPVAGEDGNLYLVWNEYDQTVTSASPPAIVNSRSIYIAMYDTKYRKLFSTGEQGVDNDMYLATWGSKWRLPTQYDGEFHNEQAAAVDQSGYAYVVDRQYNIVPDTATTGVGFENDTKESDFSSLVLTKYKPVSTLEIKDDDIWTYPVYPKAGEPVTLYVNARNYGFKPSQMATFQFEIFDRAKNQYVTSAALDEDVTVDAHIASGDVLFASKTFSMPEDVSNVKLRITAWEDNLTVNKTVKEYTVTTGDALSWTDGKAYYYDQDSVRLYGSLANLGNLSTGAVQIRLEAWNPTASTYGALKVIGPANISPSEIITLDETLPISSQYIGAGDEVNLRVQVKNSAEVKMTQNFTIDKAASVATVSRVLVNDGDAMTITAGQTGNANARILPVGAANTHTLRYTSSNPDVVAVDASSGKLIAKKVGTAVIKAEAVKYSNIYFVSADDRMYDSNGTLLGITSTGAISGGAINGSSTPVGEGTMQVTVTQAGGGDSGGGGTSGGGGGAGTAAPMVPPVPPVITNVIRQFESSTGVINVQSGTLKQMVEEKATAELRMGGCQILLTSQVLAQLAQAGSNDVTVQLGQSKTKEGRPLIDVNMFSGLDQKPVTRLPGGPITIRIPYTLQAGEDENAVVIYYIDPAGQQHMVETSGYNAGMVSFQTDHLSQYAVGYQSIPFTDVTGWAKPYISFLSAREIIVGTGAQQFSPARPVTRAEFVKMLAMLSGEEIPAVTQSPFDDVPVEKWYAPYVAWASEHGYVRGKTATTFGPKENITRQEMAVMIHRFYLDWASDQGSLGAGNSNIGTISQSRFIDSESISTYAVEAVGKLTSLGILSGTVDGKFNPRQNATRAQSAKMLTTLIQNEINKR